MGCPTCRLNHCTPSHLSDRPKTFPAMVKGTQALLGGVALAALWHLRQPAFLPPAGRMAAPAAGAVAMMGAAPAFADEIGTAAKKLADAAYPLLKDVDWNSNLALVKPGSAGADQWVKAIDTAIVMGAAMDPKLRSAAVEAHHKAIGSAGSGVTSKPDFEGIIAGLGRAIASVPESKVMDVYNSFSGVVGSDVPSYLMSTVKEADAKAAYEALLSFKDVVKSNPITPSPAVSKVSSDAASKISAAAGKLSSAAYPFLKDVEWTSDLSLKPLPGASPQKVLKAIDKALVMVAAMDGAALTEALRLTTRPLGASMRSLGPQRATSRPSMLDLVR